MSCLLGMSAALLGFWMSAVRMLYSMSKKNFLPSAFSRLNRHQQPLLPNIFLLALSLLFIILQNAGTFMNDFFNLMSFGCACAYALTMVSAMRIHHKYPSWKSDNAVRGVDAFRLLAMLVALAITYFCTLGQGIGSWISFGVYLGSGVALWLWMVLVYWKKHDVVIDTPEGPKRY